MKEITYYIELEEYQLGQGHHSRFVGPFTTASAAQQALTEAVADPNADLVIDLPAAPHDPRLALRIYPIVAWVDAMRRGLREHNTLRRLPINMNHLYALEQTF